jgi:hypothetical protein
MNLAVAAIAHLIGWVTTLEVPERSPHRRSERFGASDMWQKVRELEGVRPLSWRDVPASQPNGGIRVTEGHMSNSKV